MVICAFSRVVGAFLRGNVAEIGISMGAFRLRFARYLCVSGASCVFVAPRLRFVAFLDASKNRGVFTGKCAGCLNS